MIYITGDTHGDFTKIDFFCKKNENHKTRYNYYPRRCGD